jgi:hypothetical protein
MLKKKVSAEVIAAGLFKYMEGASGMDNILSDISPSRKGIVRRELKFLSVFAIDHGVHAELGNTPEKIAILDALYGFLRHESERFFGYSSAFILQKIKDRLAGYDEAIKTPHIMGPSFMVGKNFCEFCGDRESADLAHMGSMWFQKILQFLPLNELLKEYEIEL